MSINLEELQELKEDITAQLRENAIALCERVMRKHCGTTTVMHCEKKTNVKCLPSFSEYNITFLLLNDKI